MIGPSSYSWRWETRDRLVDNGSKAVAVLFSEDTRLGLEDWAAGWFILDHLHMPFRHSVCNP